MIACIFDTETTGLIDNHSIALGKQPEVVEFAAVRFDWDTYDIVHRYDTLIKPSCGRLPDKTIQTTGLTDADLVGAPSFKAVAANIAGTIEPADIVIAHNLSYDIEMIDIEFERLVRRVAWPAIKLCTVEQTMHVTGNRINLSGLHKMITGRPHEGAHRAMADVMATLTVLRGARERGWL
jgi:DNA polymerase-3 subunit epsilon